jgi:esterase/lipase superfamily enzyme
LEVSEALEKGREEIRSRLAQTNTKEVYVFVHGYSVKFEGSLLTIAQVWHFLGREGVPIAYSWPAGSKGLVRGYTYDHDSSEFTVYHLKQTLHFLAEMPEVEKVHVIAHSRGTGVAVSALRELHLEILASGRVTRDELKLGTVVLAAPDIDLDMIIQRAATARLGLVPERSVIYVNSGDEALGISAWLFGGKGRLGAIQSNMFEPEELARVRESKRFSIIDARVKNAGAFRHNYFYSNPAVSSDLILTLRYNKAPGAESGRPLKVDKDGFWTIDDSYPELGPPSKTD